MRRIVLLGLIFSLFLAPVAAQAETKRTQAEKALQKEQVKKKFSRKKGTKEKARQEKAEEKPAEEKKEELKALDLKLEEKLLVKTDVEQVRENIDLDTKYAPAARKRGDVSVNPEFRTVDDLDVTRTINEQEKEFKLKFNVGL